MKNSYIKHLIECNCILPQFLKLNPIIFHKFVVFSQIKPNGDFVPHYAKCNNCGAIHKVIEVQESQTIPKDSHPTIETLDEIKQSLKVENEKLVSMLETYEIELHTYQEIKFIFDNEDWGRSVILFKENLETKGEYAGKQLLIFSKSLFKIESFSTIKEE